MSFFVGQSKEMAFETITEPEPEKKPHVQISQELVERAKKDPSAFYDILGMKYNRAQKRLFDAYFKLGAQKLVLRWSRRLGKTQGVAMLFVFICLTNPKTPAVVFANSEEQVKKAAFQAVLEICSHPMIAKKVESSQALKVKFTNGSYIDAIGLGGRRENKRGTGYRLVWGDETGWMGKEINEVIKPFMLAYEDYLYIQTSTPGPSQEGLIFYDAHLLAELHAKECEEQQKELDPSRWIELYCIHDNGDGMFPDGTYVVPPKNLEEEKADYGVDSSYYKREYLALFGTLDGQFFSTDIITRAASDNPEVNYYPIHVYPTEEQLKDKRLVGAVDIAKINDDTVFYVGWVKQSGELQLIYKDVFNGLEMEAWISRIMSTINKFRLKEIMIDATGMGIGYVDTLRMVHPEVVWQDFSFASGNKPELMFTLKTALEKNLIIFPHIDVQLMNQLGDIVAEQSLKKYSNIQIYGAGGKDDHVMSLALLVKISGIITKSGSAQFVCKKKTYDYYEDEDLEKYYNPLSAKNPILSKRTRSFI